MLFVPNDGKSQHQRHTHTKYANSNYYYPPIYIIHFMLLLSTKKI